MLIDSNLFKTYLNTSQTVFCIFLPKKSSINMKKTQHDHTCDSLLIVGEITAGFTVLRSSSELKDSFMESALMAFRYLAGEKPPRNLVIKDISTRKTV